ncbi:hypothetical protein JYU14_04290 [Simkania negevensis]|uniref:Spore coat protein U domain-containing protein n=1 Tax=Simkania negevensis TaxID=83561 RepID=A0ABS3AUJ4_9BACT|nr:hypothetical protein [Simkania negevensis]
MRVFKIRRRAAFVLLLAGFLFSFFLAEPLYASKKKSKKIRLQGEVEEQFTMEFSAGSGGDLSGDVMKISSDLAQAGGTSVEVVVTVFTNSAGKYDLYYESANGNKLTRAEGGSNSNEIVSYTVFWNGAIIDSSKRLARGLSGDVTKNNTIKFDLKENRDLVAGTYSDEITINIVADAG